jgi:myo-inositol-1(or 4)-monophosphatase
VHGFPFWSVSIGLCEAGAPLIGAVVAPALGWEWWGSREASFRNGSPCRVTETPALEQALLATGFPRGALPPPADNFSSFMALERVAHGIRRCGSAAIDLCLVADGSFDAYWERELNPWDLCAGAALVLGAGGRISDLAGGPARIESGAIAASNGLLHRALLERIVL